MFDPPIWAIRVPSGLVNRFFREFAHRAGWDRIFRQIDKCLRVPSGLCSATGSVMPSRDMGHVCFTVASMLRDGCVPAHHVRGDGNGGFLVVFLDGEPDRPDYDEWIIHISRDDGISATKYLTCGSVDPRVLLSKDDMMKLIGEEASND